MFHGVSCGTNYRIFSLVRIRRISVCVQWEDSIASAYPTVSQYQVIGPKRRVCHISGTSTGWLERVAARPGETLPPPRARYMYCEADHGRCVCTLKYWVASEALGPCFAWPFALTVPSCFFFRDVFDCTVRFEARNGRGRHVHARSFVGAAPPAKCLVWLHEWECKFR